MCVWKSGTKGKVILSACALLLVCLCWMMTGDTAEEIYQSGKNYYEGKGVEQSYTEAVKWSRKAAEQGNAGGQYNLGVYYESGCGVEKSRTQAVMWYRRAAAQGFDAAKQALEDLGE